MKMARLIVLRLEESDDILRYGHIAACGTPQMNRRLL
jgi:hypothetical protein